MPAAALPSQPSRRRVASIAVACAVAGGTLQWSLREKGGTARTPVTAPVTMPSAAPLPTAESLRSLSFSNRLTSLASALPGMSTAEIAALVEFLAAQVQEGGSGRGTPGPELLLRVAFTRWAELDAPGMVAALEAPAYQFAPTTRLIAVRAWAELRGITALEAVKTKWHGIAGRVAWEVLERRPEQMAALIPLLNPDLMSIFSSRNSNHVLYDKLGPERWVHLAAALGQIGYVWSEMRNLGLRDFPLALHIAKSLPPGNAREAALGEVLKFLNPRYGQHDSVKASGVSLRTEFEALPPGRARDEAAPNYASLLAMENPQTALTWARILTDTEVRRKALAAIALSLPDGTSPAEAGFLPDELPTDAPAPADPFPTPGRDEVDDDSWAAAGLEERRRLAAAALRERSDIFTPDNKAVALFETMTPEERTLGAWYEVTLARIGKDIKEASQWVQQLPPGPERDAAATALVESLAGAPDSAKNTDDFTVTWPASERDPEAAFTWAASMSAEAERARYMTQAAKAWALDDAAAARAAVAASALPEVEKENLLHQLPEGGAR